LLPYHILRIPEIADQGQIATDLDGLPGQLSLIVWSVEVTFDHRHSPLNVRVRRPETTMQATQTMRSRLGLIGGRWRSLSGRRRFLVILILACLAIPAARQAYRWWTVWPARLELRAEQDHSPIAFSPDGSKLLTRLKWGRGMILWDVAIGTWTKTWTDADKRMRFSGAFSPDGRSLASPWFSPSPGKNFSVDLIDLGSGRVRSTFDSPLEGYQGVRFREAGRVVRLFASGRTTGQRVVDVDIASGKILADRPLSQNLSKAFLVSSSLSEDGRLLAIVGLTAPGSPGTLTSTTVWDVEQDREACRLPTGSGSSGPNVAAFTRDGRSLALGYQDGKIEIWDLPTRTLRVSSREHQTGYYPQMLAFSPDGSILASTGHFGRASLSFGMAKAIYAHVFRDREHQDLEEVVLLDASGGRTLIHTEGPAIVVFSPDSRTLATAHEDGSVQIHDVPKSR
jgi:WD40 repeat protein